MLQVAYHRARSTSRVSEMRTVVDLAGSCLVLDYRFHSWGLMKPQGFNLRDQHDAQPLA